MDESLKSGFEPRAVEERLISNRSLFYDPVLSLSWLSAETGSACSDSRSRSMPISTMYSWTLSLDPIQGFAIVGQLQDVGFQAAVLGDNLRDRAEIDHSLAQQEFQAEQRFRADNGRSGMLIREHCFGHTIHRPKRLRTLLRVDHFGDSQPVVTIHHDHFSPGDDPVSQQQFGWVLNVFV